MSIAFIYLAKSWGRVATTFVVHRRSTPEIKAPAAALAISVERTAEEINFVRPMGDQGKTRQHVNSWVNGNKEYVG